MIKDYTTLMHRVVKAVQKAHPSALLIRSSPSNGNLSLYLCQDVVR